MEEIIIIGAGGFAREVAFLIEDINSEKSKWDLLGFVSDNPDDQGKTINGYQVLGTTDYLAETESFVVTAIGSSKIRKAVNQKLEKYDLKYATLVHPNVVISPTVGLGDGVVICASCTLTTNISIGNHTIINPLSSVGHDVILEDYVSLLPGCNIAGNVLLKNGVDVGTGAQVIQGLVVGEETIIGAGATVIRDLPSNCTAVGVPAKPIKYNK